MTCTEVYYPEWSSRGRRGVKCGRPAKGEAFVRPFSVTATWKPKCGIHLRRYEQTRPLGGER